MSSDDDLRRAFGEDAARAADPDEVWVGVQQGVRRRRQRRERVGAALVLTAVAGLAISLGAYLGAPQEAGPPAERTTATASPSPTSSTPSTAPTPSTPSTPPTPPPLTDAAVPVSPADARQAFDDAGYTEDDARRLADLWRWGDPAHVAVVAGADLLAGEQLPLAPGEAAPAGGEGGRDGLYEELAAFGEAGYTQADATALAEEWDEDEQTAKVLVGHLLLQGRLRPNG